MTLPDVYRAYERFPLMISPARRCLLGIFHAAVRPITSKINCREYWLALKGFIDKNFISMGWVILLLISLLSGAKPSNDITGLSLTLS